MTIEQQLAEVVALEIAAAIEPLQRKLAAFEATTTQWATTVDQAKATITDLQIRLSVAEARALVPGPPGLDGKDANPATVMALVQGEVAKAVQQIPLPKNGKDGLSVTVTDVQPLIVAEVTKAMSLLPVPKDGKDGKDGLHGLQGKDADPVDVQALAVQVADRMLLTKGDREGAHRAEVDALKQEIAALRLDVKSAAPTAEIFAASVSEAIARMPVAKDGRDGLDGKDGARGLDGKDGRDGKDGSSVTVADVAPLIVAEVHKTVSAIPVPKDGKDGLSITVKDIQPVIADELAKWPRPKDGLSVTLADVKPLVVAEVTKAIALIPVPKNGADGQSFTLEDAAPLIAAEVAKAFAAVELPKDGVGIAGAVIDHDGALILSLTDGSSKNLGLVVGKPGRDGLPGVPGRPGENGLDGKAGVRGENGTNGKDGLGFEEMQVVFDEQKGWLLQFVRGQEHKSFPLGIPFDAGVWKSGQLYPKGAGVTFKGSWTIAQRETREMPGDGSKDWRLSVRGGKDGKPGTPGRDGRDA